MKRLVLLSIAFLAAPALAEEPQGFKDIVRPFFAKHCLSCHDEKKAKGDLRLDTLPADFNAPKLMGRWMEIMERVSSGDMPPKKQPRPKPDEIVRVAEWIAGQLTEAEAARQAAGSEKVTFNRLSREEYANTIRDLLGVTFDVADPTGLPEDPDWHGFQRIGSVLTISPAHITKYLSAAESILNEALPVGSPPKREVIRWSPFEIRDWKQFQKDYEARGIADKVRVDLVPNNGALDTRDLRIKTTGDYFVRVKLSGLRPAGGRAPRLRLYAGSIGRLLFDRDIEAPEDRPVTIEFRTHLPAGNHPIRIVNDVPGPNPEDRRSRASDTRNAFTGLKTRIPWQIKFTDDDGQPIVPFLLLDSIEWEGPVLESWPTPAYTRIFSNGGKHDPAPTRDVLARFAERAWRRPVRPAEIDRLVALAEKAKSLGETGNAPIRAALLAVLCSKSFLYLEEGNPTTATRKLDDWQLASRLSYFLWSTMPDQRLLDLAREGKLHEPEVLRTEFRRMIADPKSEQFARSFPFQWLQLRKVGMFAPDKTLYPTYDEYLEKSMVAETTGCFRDVFRRNGRLSEFLDSDWTMLNERLAEHYGIKGVHGESMRRVTLQPSDHRGGLLTQAAILSLTSDGTRHRPVHRGVWVLESIIGKPPPPPPANVPALNTPSPKAPKTTVREKLELHRSDSNCAACHAKIDPLGLAFDNYDAIGRWRTIETVKDGSGADPKIDPSGTLYDGRSFADASGLKRLLVEDVDKFADAFADKLATYAFRRAMNVADRTHLKRIVAESRKDRYAIVSLIERLVTSEFFRSR